MQVDHHASSVEAPRRPVVSVVVATHNRADLLPRALDAIFGQTYQEFEVIVVDDASTDNTQDIVASVIDSRLRYIRHERNQGVGAAYNTGIQAAQGQFIAFHDSDDRARPEWLDRLISALRAKPRAGMAWGRIRAHREADGSSAIMYRDPFHGHTESLMPTMLQWTPGATGLMLRSEVFEKVGLMDTEVGGLADLEFTIRFAGNGQFGIAYVPEILMDYHSHAGGNISSTVNERYLGHMQRIVSIHETTFEKYPCIHAQYLYSMARIMDQLDQPGATRFYRDAARLCPSTLRYRIYPIARGLHMTSAWNALSSVRTDLRGRWRNLRGPS